MALSGFYKVEFEAAMPGVGGIVVIEGENVRGADDQFLYAGRIWNAAGGGLRAHLQIQAYAPYAQSVFGGVSQRFSIELSGYEMSGGLFQLNGNASMPNVPAISIRGTHLAPLELDPE